MSSRSVGTIPYSVQATDGKGWAVPLASEAVEYIVFSVITCCTVLTVFYIDYTYVAYIFC